MNKKTVNSETEQLNSLFSLLNSEEFKNNEKLKKLLLEMYISHQVEEHIQGAIEENLFLPFNDSELSYYSLKRMLKNGI